MPDTPKSLPTKNHILNALAGDTYERLLPELERVDLPHAKVIFRAEEPITHVYFPDDAVASIIATTEDGQSAEVCVVGNEGAAGLDVLMGVDDVPHECVIQIANGGWRIKTETLRKEFHRDAGLRALLLHAIHKMSIQTSRTALCNRLHSVEERLARWLLMCHDRVEGDEIRLTQEFIAIMLGVTRTSVTLAAITLQHLELIKYSRGHINIVDRKRLEEFSCECYAIVNAEYERE